ncbi:1,4-dihydroxy-2-naphthoate polyprenyltransferase [Ruania alkalisoli]|uniref:1,4-dihydroxy-2-naphthoate octaprenyltransferase n=1 Tax=Ruania alkalisoli TaxID=2779775 RepID=A0A7M1SRH0_9MICO|nr:1,4-dihydroxy-2-naphthoate polyprenyltransferase [Ruania alkalisoli]QOR70041.1 1,4-dihydroxy-2-naphthoate polyprenyltransferase [Ruania alkalisoli]
MPTLRDWVGGARPRTLPAALAPVLAGTGAAAYDDSASLVRALLAAGVALALQVAVNFANDYSDGVRGTDDVRVGPVRLTASGTVPAATVKRAAYAAFGVAGVLGVVLCAVAGTWWLIGVGALCVLAGWYYTGGKNPYGYQGFGEVAVFVFFGLVATLGTTYTQAGRISVPAVLAACAIGALACALLMVNNVRDIPTDTMAGKRTLAVRLGDRKARIAYAGLLVAGVVCAVAIGAWAPWALLLTGLALPVLHLSSQVVGGAAGRELITVLGRTGMLELALGVGLAVVLTI